MLNIFLAQLNLTVGCVQDNTQKILRSMETAAAQHGDMILFPELALSGYPPEDLLLRSDFLEAVAQALQTLQQTMPEGLIAIVGYPEQAEGKVYNSAAVITRGKLLANYRKQILPNYGVFDEKRYFTPGEQAVVFPVKNVRCGLAICEDLWQPAPAQAAQQAGAQLLLVPNASPFHVNKTSQRLQRLRQRVEENHLPILYSNHCGAQDDLIFDGSSLALNAQGDLVAQAHFCREDLLAVQIDPLSLHLSAPPPIPTPVAEAQMYEALVLGVRDYVHKNHFQRVILGFSGGIDSALTLAIAVDALGKDNVLPLLLPARYTSALSLTTAREQLALMEMQYEEISIEPAFTALLSSLGYDPAMPPADLMAQNLQARCRAIILMAFANQRRALLLNTSNKSELAVGYGTLYGDMCGAYAVLKDVWKTQVYRLAHYRNEHPARVIPQAIIERPPTAELAPGQLDTDNLPPYEILDTILEKYIEQRQGIETIAAAGFDRTTVERILHLVKTNEYKRRQSPPGARVTPCAFTRERRFPLTTGWA